MATAFQKVYTKITQITKATCTLQAQGVGNDELAIVDGRLAQVVKIWGNDITLIIAHIPIISKDCKLIFNTG